MMAEAVPQAVSSVTLMERYSTADLRAFAAEESARFLDRTIADPQRDATLACASLQQSKIKRMDINVAQRRGHVTIRNANGKTLDHGGFAHACFASEDWVVLAAAHQNVDDLTNLVIAAKHWIELAFTCALRQVYGELIEVRRFAARRRRRASRCTRSARSRSGCSSCSSFTRESNHALKLLTEIVNMDLAELTKLARKRSRAIAGQHGQQHHARANLRDTKLQRGDVPCTREQINQLHTERRPVHVAAGALFDLPADLGHQACFVQTELLDDAAEIAIWNFDQPGQQVFGLYFVVRTRLRQARRGIQR